MRGPAPTPAIERFWKYVDQTPTCWIWTGGKSGNYGGFFGGPSQADKVYAHRFSYQHFVEPIPDDLVINHLCEVKLCVNPDHLEVVTYKDNARYGDHHTAHKARQTHCVNGHSFDKDNTYIRPNGCRSCRVCGRKRKAAEQHARA